MAEDHYTENAEWYAALVAGMREGTNAAVGSLIGSVEGGTVVDIASGTGICLPLLHRLGAGRLCAVEPSASMRVGLMTTIAADPDLMVRTTIIPAPVPDALDLLPERWDAAVLLNAIGHLDDQGRARLWEALRDRLVPGGRFVVSLQPPADVTTVPWTDFGEIPVGEHRIRTRGGAEPSDDTHVVWTMEWTLLDAAGEVLTQRTATHPWRVLTRTELDAEAASWGFSPAGWLEEPSTGAYARA